MTLYSPEVPMPPGPTITVSDVHLRYRAQQAPVLAGVNLTISAGTVHCLLGPSGAGKTSLLKVQLKQVDADLYFVSDVLVNIFRLLFYCNNFRSCLTWSPLTAAG